MNLSGLILLSSLWLLAVLLIVSFLAGARRLRGDDEEEAEESLSDAPTDGHAAPSVFPRRAGKRP